MPNNHTRPCRAHMLALLFATASVGISGCFGGSGGGNDRSDTRFLGGDAESGFAFAEMRLLYLTHPDFASPNTLFGIDIEGNAGIISHPIDPGSSERITSYYASPNERYVAYTSSRDNSGNALRITDLDESIIIQPLDNDDSNVSELTWNHTGNQLLFVNDVPNQPRVVVWDAATEENINLANADDAITAPPIWSPDSTHVFYATHGSNDTVTVHSFDMSGHSQGMQDNDPEAFANLFSEETFVADAVDELGVSADGNYIHVVLNEDTLHVLDVDMNSVGDGADIIDAHRSTGATPLYARWSHVGANIAYVDSKQNLIVNSVNGTQQQTYNSEHVFSFAWGGDTNLAFVNGTGSVMIADDATTDFPRSTHQGQNGDDDTARYRVSWVGDDVFFSARNTDGYALYLNGRQIASGFTSSDLKMRAPETVSINGSNLLFPTNNAGFALFNTASGGNVTTPTIAQTLTIVQAAWIKPGHRDNKVLGLLTRGTSNINRLRGANEFGGNATEFDLPVADVEEILDFKPY